MVKWGALDQIIREEESIFRLEFIRERINLAYNMNENTKEKFYNLIDKKIRILREKYRKY